MVIQYGCWSIINGVLFLNLKKTFDTVDHKILLAKPYSYDIRGTSDEWFRSYLQNRKQICSIDNLHNKLTFDLGKKNKIFYYS